MMLSSLFHLTEDIHGGLRMGGRRPMIGIGDEESIEAALGLGELAGLTVSNEADALSYDVSMMIR